MGPRRLSTTDHLLAMHLVRLYNIPTEKFGEFMEPDSFNVTHLIGNRRMDQRNLSQEDLKFLSRRFHLNMAQVQALLAPESSSEFDLQLKKDMDCFDLIKKK